VVNALWVGVSANAQVLPLLDDFDDRNVQDGTPATWVLSSYSDPRFPDGTVLSGESGDLRMNGVAIIDRFPILGDTSIRTRITLPANVGTDNVFVGVQARRNDETADGYSAALWPTTKSAFIARETGGTILNPGTVSVELDVTKEDVMMQFDAIGDT
jgi:hypothetical protein